MRSPSCLLYCSSLYCSCSWFILFCQSLSSFFLLSKLEEYHVLWLHCGQEKSGISLPLFLFQLISLFSFWVGSFFFQLLPGMGNVFLELVIHTSSGFKLFTAMLSICEWAWRKINVKRPEQAREKSSSSTFFLVTPLPGSELSCLWTLQCLNLEMACLGTSHF